jgi:hypothetical protein
MLTWSGEDDWPKASRKDEIVAAALKWRAVPPLAALVEVAAALAPRQVSGLPVGETAFASPTAGWAVVGRRADYRLLYTEDAGATWKPQLAWYGMHYGKVSAFDARRAGLVLAADHVNGYPVGRGNCETVFASTEDAGVTWTLGSPPDRQGSSFYFLTPRHAWELVAVLDRPARKDLARTEDGGATWCRIEGPDNLPRIQVAFSSATDGLLVAADRHRADLLYVTADGGTTWTREPLTAPPGVPASAETWLRPVVRPGVGVLLLLRALSRRKGTFAYSRRSGGHSWSGPYRLPMTPTRSRDDLLVLGGDARAWAASGHDVWVADHIAGPWEHRPVPLSEEENIADIAPVGQGVLWLTTTRGHPMAPTPSGELYRSEDDGVRWTRLSAASPDRP